jgi:DNA-binding NtrC family response regulator
VSADTLLTAGDPGVTTREPPTADRAVLVVYLEGETAATTRVIELADGAQVTIGRSRSADVMIESDRISRVHAQFARKQNLVWVEDLGSRNGTHVNGESIATCALASGDEVVIGPATVVLTITSRVVARPRIEGIRHLEERLAAEVDRGRYRRTFALAMLRLTGEPSDIDAAVDRVAARLHPMETLAEYSATEYAIVLPELEGAAAREAAVKLAAAASTGGAVGATVGVALFPQHGTTTGTLLARAHAAVDAARGSAEVGLPPDDPTPFGADVLVKDPQMVRVYELARKVADHPITVLVVGETGVGKEVVASAIHHASLRSAGPLVRLNCASLPETLLESELFGHEKGAFTGADRRKQGYFEAAQGGTLFLDEIGELSAATQAKLLRVLEEHRITRVGGTEELDVDVRVVCATNRDLLVQVERGAFRSDLFFRISAFTILIPPLRDRPGEILMLAEHFIDRAIGSATGAKRRRPRLSTGAAMALRSYAWPGNVRELRNAIERAVVLHSGSAIEIEDLPDRLRDVRVDLDSPAAQEWQNVGDRVAAVERSAIAAALEATGGNQTEAAKQLGLSRRTLIYRMEKYGFKPPPAGRGRES